VILDLFCKAGGAGMGYHWAGFDVVGVDIEPQPRYPFEFHQADAFEFFAAHWREFDAHHGSPPCQGYSTITPDKSIHPKLIGQVREMFRAAGRPYVIENVEGARRELDHPIRLCGSSFGLSVRRHRYFETTFEVLQPPCVHYLQPQPIGVYGHHGGGGGEIRPNGTRRGRVARTTQAARDAMGIDWMRWRELAEAIPPVYTEYLGRALVAAL